MNDKDKIEILLTALKKIAQPQGAYSQDAETYLKNVIAKSTKIAEDALFEVEGMVTWEKGE